MYFYLGNCHSESKCFNGVYTDDNSTRKCKCLTNNKCKTCNDENLCESCNTEEGFYPKSDENREDG